MKYKHVAAAWHLTEIKAPILCLYQAGFGLFYSRMSASPHEYFVKFPAIILRLLMLCLLVGVAATARAETIDARYPAVKGFFPAGRPLRRDRRQSAGRRGLPGRAPARVCLPDERRPPHPGVLRPSHQHAGRFRSRRDKSSASASSSTRNRSWWWASPRNACSNSPGSTRANPCSTTSSSAPARRGQVAIDSISGATITVMVENATLMRSVRRVAESRGLAPPALPVPRNAPADAGCAGRAGNDHCCRPAFGGAGLAAGRQRPRDSRRRARPRR